MKIALKSDRVTDPVFVPMRRIANKIGHSSWCGTKTESSSRAQLRTFSSPQVCPYVIQILVCRSYRADCKSVYGKSTAEGAEVRRGKQVRSILCEPPRPLRLIFRTWEFSYAELTLASNPVLK